MSESLTANPDNIRYEIVVLEPPVAGQLETTVEQTGIWRHQDRYIVERQAAYAQAIARILGCGSYVGRTIANELDVNQAEHDINSGAKLFFLPHTTLCDPMTVARLGINATNFYGGSVHFLHERTKLIIHKLPPSSTAQPEGWNHHFAEKISPLCLPGYTAFNLPDLAAAAKAILFNHPQARIKLATGSDGIGQFVVKSPSELDTVLEQVAATNTIQYGACVEVNLTESTTYSINTEHIGALKISSVGVHRRHMEFSSEQTEVGTDYSVVAGDIDKIKLNLTDFNQDHLRRIITIVHDFDQSVHKSLPHAINTRKTYQAIIGVDARGDQHAGVLEQSWRRGASSANTLLAAQELLNDSRLTQVNCSQDNAYSEPVQPKDWVLSTCRDLPYVARITRRHYI